MKIEIPQFIETGSWECDYSLERLIKQIDEWVKEEGLELNPDFQRGHVWNEKQQVEYVQTILSGGAKNARVIYLNNPNWMRYSDRNYKDFVCVDGLQRITAIRRFVNGEIKPYGYTYDEINTHRKLEMSHNMRINVNDLPTKNDVLVWYIEMNEGGTPHTKEEIDRVKELLK